MGDSLKGMIGEVDPRSLGVILDKLLDLAREEQEWGVPGILTACMTVAREDISLGRKLATFLMDRPASQIKASIVPKISGEQWSAEVFSKWQGDGEVTKQVKSAIARRMERK
jgi:predicted KAP-like P-loop ATPase